jgi:hypothetical protein
MVASAGIAAAGASVAGATVAGTAVVCGTEVAAGAGEAVTAAQAGRLRLSISSTLSHKNGETKLRFFIPFPPELTNLLNFGTTSQTYPKNNFVVGEACKTGILNPIFFGWIYSEIRKFSSYGCNASLKMRGFSSKAVVVSTAQSAAKTTQEGAFIREKNWGLLGQIAPTDPNFHQPHE